jgi:hypothetical protein
LPKARQKACRLSLLQWHKPHPLSPLPCPQNLACAR